jgi:hypothetical protein
MWKTHAFRRALGPLLRQLDADYDISAEQVSLLMNSLEVVHTRQLDWLHNFTPSFSATGWSRAYT